MTREFLMTFQLQYSFNSFSRTIKGNFYEMEELRAREIKHVTHLMNGETLKLHFAEEKHMMPPIDGCIQLPFSIEPVCKLTCAQYQYFV